MILLEKAQSYFEKLNRSIADRHYIRQIIACLSIVVILVTFWSLKLTGIGIAGEAFCGKEEHIHSQACMHGTQPCTREEHIHDKTCYSDIYRDLETDDIWNQALGDMARGPTTRENLVLVAQSQLGYAESAQNFLVDKLGVRRGITRYGQWYGNPYGDWSAMFAAFCLHYAGVEDAPVNAGSEGMRLEWETAGLYIDAAQGLPETGNLLFFQKEEGGSQGADAVAVITGFDGTTITAVEGNIENTVVQTTYTIGEPAILGYGLVPQKEVIKTIEEAVPLAASCTIWLDGTDGGMAHLTGSPNTAYTVEEGSTIQLPDQWTSPGKYSYKLRGWYDVTNSRYYFAGANMVVTGNAVLYADWVASTYDIGQFNAQVADTVSTNAFITTHMFDYNYLFNVQSANVTRSSISGTSHSETWSMVSTGNVNYRGSPTADLIFSESDSGGQLTNPNNKSARNTYRNADTISTGICTPEIRDLLFSTSNSFNPATGEGVIGKTYLGTGDHLFQIMDDPDDEHYGYYYYDSLRNAVSYNQSQKRFYIYEYLSATSDAMGSSYADFLPLNSPYANTNGKTVGTYTYNGHYDEYRGVTHYRFDTEYSGGSYNSANNAHTEFAYGMRSEINFFLPNEPGSGNNRDLYGHDIEFQFSGDDDLWVLIDGILVLDIGGIHQRIGGEINFSTGTVTVNGSAAASLMDLGIGAGDHTLTVLYLERGASMSNCSIYFNLVPRFSLELAKEDVLTQQQLNRAQFTVYEDFECTVPAQLWSSEDAYLHDLADGILDDYRSTFTVLDGTAKIWGFGSGSTYYIKETGPPNVDGYGKTNGLIRLTIEKAGIDTYKVDVIADAEGNAPSNGFTVHGVNIDEATKKVYIVVTNAPETVTETTTVQIIKKWADNTDHSADYIKAYLTVTDPDGTVRRIREITLSAENNWMYTWTNLPKYDYDALTTIHYGVEESYESGYYSTVREITQIQVPAVWAEAASFQKNESYLLKTGSGCLSTTSTTDGKLKWVDEETAKNSPLATWTATFSGNAVKLTNGAGQILSFNYSSYSSSNRYFYATTGSASYQTFNVTDAGSGLRLYVTPSRTNYYMSNSGITSNGRISSTSNENNGLILIPLKKISDSDVQDVMNFGYQITNTPLPTSNETSMTVKKEWVVPEGYDSKLYQEFAVTVRLLANGVNTGRSMTLNLKNGWQGVFQGLPYKDDNGNVIVYTVEEVWDKKDWTTTYGEIQTVDGTPPTYSVVITNSYEPGGPMLPTTGTAARLMYVLCGSGIMLGALVYGIGSRRKRERGQK